jgi:hypothetical protein
MGAMLVDGSGNLMRTLQSGIHAQYVITTSTTTAVVPNIVNGTQATYSTTSPTLASVSVSGFVPPIATEINLLVTNAWKGNTATGVLVAPNVSYGGTNNGPLGSAGQSWPYSAFATVGIVASFNMVLEGTTIAWASTAAGGAISCLGWTVGGVNAN